MGLSLGGAVAGMLAGDRKDDVKTLCVWSCAGKMKERNSGGEMAERRKAAEKDGFVDCGGNLLGYGYFLDLDGIDEFARSAPFDKNVLIIHAENDVAITLDISEKYLELYGDRGELKIIRGADHGYSSRAWEDEVIESTVRHMAENL